MKYQRIEVENNKCIEVWDDVFPLTTRAYFYRFMESSLYTIGWSDGPVPEWYPHNRFMHSKYSPEDLDNLGILKDINNTPIKDSIAGLSIGRSIVNLSVPVDSYHIHSHRSHKVFLYYANLEWDPNWYGETLFVSEDQKDILWAGVYTPGRCILFDGSIPHTIRPQSITAPVHRFTFAIELNDPEQEQ